MAAKFPVIDVHVGNNADPKSEKDGVAFLRLSPRPFKSGDMGYFGTAPITVGGKKLEVKVMIGKSLADMRKDRGEKKKK